MTFPIFLIIFIVFWTGYLLLAASMVYHVWEYSLPGRPIARILTTAFMVVSIILFLLSALFLLGIYKLA